MIPEGTPKVSIMTQPKERYAPQISLYKQTKDCDKRTNDITHTGFKVHHKTEGSDGNCYNNKNDDNFNPSEQCFISGEKTAHLARHHNLKDEILGTDTCFDITDLNINREITQSDTSSKNSYNEFVPFNVVLDKALLHLQQMDWDNVAITASLYHDNKDLQQNSYERHINIVENITVSENHSEHESFNQRLIKVDSAIKNSMAKKHNKGVVKPFEAAMNGKEVYDEIRSTKIISHLEIGNTVVDLESKTEISAFNIPSSKKRNNVLHIERNGDKASKKVDNNTMAISFQKNIRKTAVILPNKRVKRPKEDPSNNKKSITVELYADTTNEVDDQPRQSNNPKSHTIAHNNRLNPSVFNSKAISNTSHLKKEYLLSNTKICEETKINAKNMKKLKRCRSTKKKLFEDVEYESNPTIPIPTQSNRHYFIKQMMKDLASRNTIGGIDSYPKSKDSITQQNDEYKIAYRILQREFVDLSSKYETMIDNYSKIVDKLQATRTYSVNDHTSNSTAFMRKQRMLKDRPCASSTRLSISQIKKYIKMAEDSGDNRSKKYENMSYGNLDHKSKNSHWKFKSADLTNICQNKQREGVMRGNGPKENTIIMKSFGLSSLRVNSLQRNNNTNALTLSSILRQNKTRNN